MTTPTRAAGYVRVSTAEQVENGWNLDADRERIRDYAGAQGWELVEIFDDGGLQGDDPNRPDLLRLLDCLDGIDVVVLRSIERLARDPMILGLATNAFRAANVKLHSFITGPIDIETPQGEFTSSLFAAIGKLEKRMTGQRVKQAMQARAREGLLPGGHAPYGYAWKNAELVVVEAAIVRRIFNDYVTGMGQREIVRALNDAAVPTRQVGRKWQQSAITRILNRVTYTGKLPVAGADGEWLDGKHEPIIDGDLWERAQATLSGRARRNGGRQADGGHLLVRGLLRCTCGSAMVPRKARKGVERERYVCRGRIEDPRSCSQPSIRRELIDEPFLATLLDGYLDLEATKQRVEERAAAALAEARQALTEADTELKRVESRMARVRRGWQDDVIDDAEYVDQTAELTHEHEGARAALEQAHAHVEQVEREGSLPGDAEQTLLDHLAAVKQAVGENAEAAPDLRALRNVIGDMFEAVHLGSLDPLRFPEGVGDGFIPFDDDLLPTGFTDGKVRYWLLPMLRWSAVDASTFRPMGQAMPVPDAQSYPPGFLARYCWW